MAALSPYFKRKGIRHLKEYDPVMREVIEQVGPCRLRSTGAGLEMLVRSILSQQLSTKVAATLRERLEVRLGRSGYSPKRIAKLSVAELREIGLSQRKAEYVIGAAEAAICGEVCFEDFANATDEDVIETLTSLRGVGVWTAKMHLIFALGRLDVLPHEDLGVRMAIRNLYGLDDLPDQAECERIAEPWRPYASLASWYCWRSLEAVPNS